jgi:hypothetical protein
MFMFVGNLHASSFRSVGLLVLFRGFCAFFWGDLSMILRRWSSQDGGLLCASVRPTQVTAEAIPPRDGNASKISSKQNRSASIASSRDQCYKDQRMQKHSRTLGHEKTTNDSTPLLHKTSIAQFRERLEDEQADRRQQDSECNRNQHRANHSAGAEGF